MMIVTRLYTNAQMKSDFEDVALEIDGQHPLGAYSKSFPVSTMQMREFDTGMRYDMHNAPRSQYIVYLSGEVKVTTSGGESRIFKAGDVLLAEDLTGEGHITETLTAGRSLIIAA